MASKSSLATDGQNLDNQIAQVIQASSKHDLGALEKCVNEYSFRDCKAVDVQDPATGFSPLHAAIALCRSSTDGEASEVSSQQDAAISVIRFLLENGAIWNQLDNHDETPGCLAYRLGLTDLYQLMVDAGVRAEMILSRLEEYERMEDGEGEGEEEEEEAEGEEERANPEGQIDNAESQDANGEEVLVQRQDVNGSTYLSSALSLTSNRLLDEQQNGVMMAWESDIMKESASALLPEPGLKILNIGFGMGIIDTHIQQNPNKPASHHIVEAHPDVLADMESKEWADKAGVVVHHGKWQDVLPRLAAEGEMFDAIYFDTFAESYSEFREFFSEQVMALLDQGGRWSFFNGMGADRQISYDVYQKVVELDLFEAGFDVEWKDVELPKLDREWEGVRRKYWNIDHYRLPVCKFME
ncbi:Arginine N-methyltransferase 2 [Exophiala xenobiotica]|nr:Arginine N-methyltransferase 2 [Exophiala xenobiotica]